MVFSLSGISGFNRSLHRFNAGLPEEESVYRHRPAQRGQQVSVIFFSLISQFQPHELSWTFVCLFAGPSATSCLLYSTQSSPSWCWLCVSLTGPLRLCILIEQCSVQQWCENFTCLSTRGIITSQFCSGTNVSQESAGLISKMQFLLF